MLGILLFLQGFFHPLKNPGQVLYTDKGAEAQEGWVIRLERQVSNHVS